MVTLRYVSAADFRGLLEAGGGPAPSTDVEIPTSWTDDQLAVFLTSAESELEARLRVRYPMPLAHDPPAPIVVQLVVALASYQVMLAIRKNADFESEQDPYLLRYQWADAMLTRLSKGEADLPPTGAEPDDGFGSQAFELYRDRLFSRSDFGLDPAPGDGSRVTRLRRYMR